MAYKAEEMPEEYEYRKKEREIRKRNHFCIQCGRQDSYTLSGRSRCFKCCKEANKAEQLRDKEKRNQQQKKIRDKRALAGLCTRCGKRKVQPGRKICDVCCKKTGINSRKRRIKEGTNWPRGDNGYCWTCNKRPALPGRKLCEECYSKTLDSQKKATERHRENGFGSFALGVEAYWNIVKAEKSYGSQKSV